MRHDPRTFWTSDIAGAQAPAAGAFWFYFGFGHRAHAWP